MGIALGPLVGGAVVDGLSWQWIFWINVPLGVALLPLAAGFLRESRGEATRLDLPGVALVTTGLFALVFGLVRGQGEGWTSPLIVGSLSAGAVLLAAFVAHERRTDGSRCSRSTCSPSARSRSRTPCRSSCTSGRSARSSSSPSSSSRSWATRRSTPASGCSSGPARPRSPARSPAILAERRGPRDAHGARPRAPGRGAGVAGDGGRRRLDELELAAPFAIAGIGMGLVFAPSASALLSVVAPQRAGQASGTNNAIREVGGVFGVAVMSTIFSGAGGFASPQAFVDGFRPALWVGAAVVGVGARRGAAAARPAARRP